jgi:hypothetical protein
MMPQQLVFPFFIGEPGRIFSRRTEAAEDSDGSMAGRRGTSKFPAVSCAAA